MYQRKTATNLSDLKLPLSKRGGAGVYFVRICQGGAKMLEALWDIHEAARAKGVIIEGQITNPDERQLSYLQEQIGADFQANADFIKGKLEKWMPRMSPSNRAEFAKAMSDRFDELRAKGKNESILKNVYFKLMCWLYYKFERLAPFLGDDEPPRILYESDGITAHELILLRMLNSVGADIVLLEITGDSAYLKQDPSSEWSQLLPGSEPFAKDFSLKGFRKEMSAKMMAANRPAPAAPMGARTANTQRPTAAQPGMPRAAAIDPESRFPKPERTACTNAWMKHAEFTQIVTPIVSRGDDHKLFYNAFIRIKGVTDKLTFTNELYQFYQQFKATGRNIVIVDDGLDMPGADEVQSIRRRNYRTIEEMIVDLAGNLPACANVDLQRCMQLAFVRVMKAAAETEQNINRLVVSAVYLLAWIQRYQASLFKGYRGNEIPCFVLMGGCRNQHDSLFVKYLAQLPVDVLIVACDLNRICELNDSAILELEGADSIPVMPFPKDAGTLQMRTMASHAEQDLTGLLYSDSGIYRNHQFAKAESITLQTTFDELFILWDQELKYRQNFSTANDIVNMPVIYAKISGVESGKEMAYWQKIKLLLGDNTYFVKQLPVHHGGEINQFYSIAVKVLKSGKLRREEIKADRQYPFALLREELQDHILDKLQLMLDRRLIKGTFENGTEYTIIATVLNIKKEILRMLQSFDFTKSNPKIVCISSTDQPASLEDTILLTFLNLVGFDIAIFVPTGYQIIRRYLNDNYPVEHQIGEFMYDLTVPDIKTLPPLKRSWLDNIFKRGN